MSRKPPPPSHKAETVAISRSISHYDEEVANREYDTGHADVSH